MTTWLAVTGALSLRFREEGFSNMDEVIHSQLDEHDL